MRKLAGGATACAVAAFLTALRVGTLDGEMARGFFLAGAALTTGARDSATGDVIILAPASDFGDIAAVTAASYTLITAAGTPLKIAPRSDGLRDLPPSTTLPFSDS